MVVWAVEVGLQSWVGNTIGKAIGKVVFLPTIYRYPYIDIHIYGEGEDARRRFGGE